MTESDQFLLLASDGLFNVFNEVDLVDFVLQNMRQHGDAQKCCQVSRDQYIK